MRSAQVAAANQRHINELRTAKLTPAQTAVVDRIRVRPELDSVNMGVDVASIYKQYRFAIEEQPPHVRDEIEKVESEKLGFKETTLIIGYDGLGRRVSLPEGERQRDERAQRWDGLIKLKSALRPKKLDKALSDCVVLPGLGERSLFFAHQIGLAAGMRVASLSHTIFADREVRPNLRESIDGKHVFLVTSFGGLDGHRQLWSQFMDAGLAKFHGAKKITVLDAGPMYDRSDVSSSEDPDYTPVRHVSGVLLRLDVLKSLGVTSSVCIEPHAANTQLFKPKEMRYKGISGIPLLIRKIAEDYPGKTITLFCADRSQAARMKADFTTIRIKEILGYVPGIVVCDKVREGENQIGTLKIVEGAEYLRVPNSVVAGVDDIVDTAGTMIKGAIVAHEGGAEIFVVAGVHGILSWDAVTRMERETLKPSAKRSIQRVYVLDTRDIPAASSDFLRVTSSADVLARVAVAIGRPKSSSINDAIRIAYGLKPLGSKKVK